MRGQCNIDPSMGEADYRLAPVQKVRALDERAKQGDLAGAAADAKKSQAKVDVATARVASIRAAIDRARAAPAPTTASAMVVVEQYIARLRRDLDAALDELDRASAVHRGQLDAVDGARAKLARARADKEIVERHFARWRDEKRKLAERRED
jgi:flagellar export protein FliJ